MLTAFQITILGMGLVFAEILLLWLMMTVLTRITADSASDSPEVARVPNDSDLAQAAAIAVAVALAEQEGITAHALELPPTAMVSAWQLGMRTRQMYEKGHRAK